MDYNQSIEFAHQVEEDIWFDQVKTLRLDGRLCDWVTTFHPQNLPCSPIAGILNGSYNSCQKFVFEDETVWLLRFPRVMGTSPEYADEKVAMEVEALHLIREKTSIPVPNVKAWGLADSNPLGLGPFILMEFIEGVSLGEIFKDGESRILREDIPESDIEFVYRQMANTMLQLFDLNFDRIGSLPTPRTGYSVPIRPLTWKTHDILRTGGVNTFGDRTRGFSTTTEYFQYINGQDWQQFRHQPNSVTAGELDCAFRYASLDILKSTMPQFVNAEYEKGPFKLICDDFGPANMIVKSREDLTIVGVVDLEWVYAGPAQLFASAPWWLLLDRPINPEWDFESDNPPRMNERYLKCLNLFKRVLAEEEAKLPRYQERREVSKLVQWSEDSGAMWLHMLLSSGFFDMFTFPFMHLRQRLGVQRWRDHVDKIKTKRDVKNLMATKLKDLDQYDKQVEKLEQLKASKDNGQMTREEFITTAYKIVPATPISPRRPSLHQRIRNIWRELWKRS